jgi:Fe-S oxidoreductase
VFEHGEDLRLYHRDGNRKNFRVANLVYYHPTCYAQRYIGTSEPIVKLNRRVLRGVCHA